MKPKPVTCPQCKAKYRADRDRCPRCRARLVPIDPAVVAAASRRFARISLGLAGAFVVIVGALWFTRPPAPVPVRPGPVADPFAGRRAAVAAPATAAAAAPVPAQRPFVDTSGKGVMAYGGGDYASAVTHFQEAVATNPSDAESWSNLGQVLVRLNRTPEALPCFERAIALIPSRWAYRFNMARALGQLGRLDESIAAYREAQRLFPDDYATAFNLALALHKKGDEEAAVGQYQKAIALNPEDASFRMALASSYERLQKPADAAAAYAEALRLAPAAPDADKVRARIAQLTGTPSDSDSGR
jgi:Flp pilus assembly protein TadD